MHAGLRFAGYGVRLRFSVCGLYCLVFGSCFVLFGLWFVFNHYLTHPPPPPYTSACSVKKSKAENHRCKSGVLLPLPLQLLLLVLSWFFIAVTIVIFMPSLPPLPTL
jgi:hypothetical protein